MTILEDSSITDVDGEWYLLSNDCELWMYREVHIEEFELTHVLLDTFQY